MIKSKTYKALFLFGIFIFPLIFQTAHRIKHHNQALQSCCEHTYCHETLVSTVNILGIIIKEDDHCLICAYDFFIKSFTGYLFPGFMPIESHLNYVESSTLAYKAAPVALKKSRAPPVMPQVKRT